MSGSYWRNICRGHLVSDDMVNWIQIREAITPTEDSVVPDGVWSGNAAYDKNGVPLLFFTAGNDNFIKQADSDMYHLKVTFKVDTSLTTEGSSIDEFGINLKTGSANDCTTYRYKISTSTIYGETNNKGDGAPTSITSGKLSLTQNGLLAMDIYGALSCL